MKKILLKIFLFLTIFLWIFNIANASSPVLDDSTWAVDDNASIWTEVLTVSGSYDDWDLIYSILSWNTGSVFAIDSNSWTITVSGSLDHYTIWEYQLIVEATASWWTNSWETDTWVITITVNDKTNPVFDKIELSSSNSNTNFAKAGDDITFSLYINPADTWKAGNHLEFSIWNDTGLNSWNFTKSEIDPILSRNKSYTIQAGQSGTIEVTDIVFQDAFWNTLTGFTSPYSSWFNITVDTTAPDISISDDIVEWPVQSDTLQIDASDANADTWTYQYAFIDSGATCGSGVSFTETFTSGSWIVFNDETHNGKYICAKAWDLAWNVSYIKSANPLNIDITPPTIINSKIYSNNSNSWAWAKVGDKITLELEFSEAINMPTVQILWHTWTVSQSGSSNIYIASYTWASNDTEWEVAFNVSTTDIAGNSLTWVVNATTDSSKVIFDRTKPNFSMKTWSRTNTINLQYAVLDRVSDPGTENISDNLQASWSLTEKSVIVYDHRPAPGPNITWNYTIVYKLSDVAWNTKYLTRYVWIYWQSGSSSYRKMDVCNETNWDHSGDYYDWKCTKDEVKKEETTTEAKQETKINSKTVEKKSSLKETKVTIKKWNIFYVNNDIQKYKANKENVVKFKKAIKQKFDKKINSFSKARISKILKRIDAFLAKVENMKNISQKKKALIIDVLIALKEVFLEK